MAPLSRGLFHTSSSLSKLPLLTSLLTRLLLHPKDAALVKVPVDSTLLASGNFSVFIVLDLTGPQPTLLTLPPFPGP